MPILSISGQTLEFQAFWCDARDPAGLEPGLVAIAFAQYLPADCGLAVIGEYGGKQHGLLLWDLAQGTSEGCGLLGVPVPAEWNNFKLILTPFAAAAVGPPVTLEFARHAPQGTVSAATGQVLHVVAAWPTIEVKLRSGYGAAASRLRLYQYGAGDKILPSKRMVGSSTAPYRLELRLPKPSVVTDPWPRRSSVSDSALRINVYAQDADAIHAIGDTLLWYASQAQLAQSDGSTLGTFEPDENRGFIPIVGARRRPDMMEFVVHGAVPGDVFCLAPGLEDAAISLGSGFEPAPEGLDNGLLVFELDREGRAARLAAGMSEPPNPHGARIHRIKREAQFKPLRDELDRIQRQWAGGKNAIGSLADSFGAEAASGYPEDLAAMEVVTDTPAQFALCAVLLHELQRRAAGAAADLAAIVRPGEARMAERICSAAAWRAAGDAPSRAALSRLTGGTYYPWRAPDGLGAIFQTVFEEQAETGNDRAAAAEWYKQTDQAPAARMALLAIERQASERAWIMIRAQITPDLADLGKSDLADITRFCQSYMLQKSADPALSDTIRFACGDLELHPELSRVAVELLDRIRNIETARHASPGMFLAVDQLRRLRAEIEDDVLAARLDQIRGALEFDASGAATVDQNRPTTKPDDAILKIPRFERGQPPLEERTGATDLIEKLTAQGKLPDHWDLLRAEAIARPWPAAALAALLATLTHHPPKQSALHEGEPDPTRTTLYNEALVNAAVTGRSQSDADAGAASYLFDDTPAPTDFIGELKDRARKIVEEYEHTLGEYSDITIARRKTAARAIALVRLTDIVQDTINSRLDPLKNVSDRVTDALDHATRDSNDPGRQRQLDEIRRAKAELSDRYADVRQALIAARNSGRAVLDQKVLMEVGQNLKTALRGWHEMSRLRARIREIHPGAVLGEDPRRP
jgi:hypothetical protein